MDGAGQLVRRKADWVAFADEVCTDGDGKRNAVLFLKLLNT